MAAFCRMVRERSVEHRGAMAVLGQQRFVSVALGLLRQELDSMVRVIYLLTTRSRPQRLALVRASLAGARWFRRDPGTGKKKLVTDREMVARANQLRGWSNSVYRFGCSFIHLSNFHDYRARDPFLALPVVEQRAVLEHLRYYHGGPATDSPGFSDLLPYIPRVFDKVHSNLGHYVVQLEGDGDLEEE